MPGTKKIVTIDKTGFISVTIYNCFENVSMNMKPLTSIELNDKNIFI